MARPLWLHRCGMRCHRHLCWGIHLDSWSGRNSWGLAHLGCQCCRCIRCGLHMLCRLWWCRLCLQCGSCATWDSVNCFDTAFTKVSPHAMVCGTIAGAYLIAVPWLDTYHSSRNPNLLEGVIHCNWLTSIQWHKCFATFVSL